MEVDPPHRALFVPWAYRMDAGIAIRRKSEMGSWSGMFNLSRVFSLSRRAALYLFIVGCCILSVAVFFRVQIANDFAIQFSDRYDGGIQVALNEHWFNVFRGVSSWRQGEFFYPQTNTLGYNDGYFLFGVGQTIFRVLGLDMFLSAELVNVAVKITGFVSFFLMATAMFGINPLFASLGAVVFVLSNNSYQQAGHAQLFTVAFVPLFSLLIWKLYKSLCEGHTRRIMTWAALAAAFFGAWLITAFYMLWFTVYYISVLLIVYFVSNPGVFRETPRVARLAWRPMLGALVLFGLSLIPFVVTYGPKLAETGGHSFDTAFGFLPSIFDTFNIGAENWMFGRAYTAVSDYIRPNFPRGGEHAAGLTPVFLAAYVSSVIYIILKMRTENRFAFSVAVASVLAWALTLHFGTFTLWRYIYHYFPGAMAVRVVVRYQIFAVVPALIIILICIEHLRTSRNFPIILGLLAVMAVEQISVGWPLGIQRSDEMERLVRIGPPPKECRAFYASTRRTGSPGGFDNVDAVYGHNVDAMLIAEHFGIPTINGMGTFVAPGWNFMNPESISYKNRVAEYAVRFGITGLCELDIFRSEWIK